jgi:hypothetical protein
MNGLDETSFFLLFSLLYSTNSSFGGKWQQQRSVWRHFIAETSKAMHFGTKTFAKYSFLWLIVHVAVLTMG